MPNNRVTWTGSARYAALCVACPNCNREIGRECWQFDMEASEMRDCEPHPSRRQFAHALGFREVADAPLLEEPREC